MRKILLFVLATITNTTLFAQETLKDVVPVLKGTKFGLQYHSGKQFYPPVFDFVQWNDEAETPTFYFTDEDDNIYFKVIKQEKLYKLSSNKKLVFLETIPRFTPPRILRDEMVEDETIPDFTKSYDPPRYPLKGGLVFIDSFKTHYDNTARITIWYDADKRLYRFKQENDWLKEFDCDKIVTMGDGAADYSWAVLEKGSRQAMADLRSRRLVLPFEYESIRRVFSEAFIVQKDGKQGVVNNLNEFIIPPSYQSISASGQADGYCFLYGQNENGFNIIGVELYQPTSQSTRIMASGYDVMPRAFVAHTASGPHVYFIVSQKNKLGIIDYEGKQILPAEYDDIRESEAPSPYADPPRFLWLSKDKLNGWMDIGTQTLVKPTYSHIRIKLQLEKQIKEFPVYIFLIRKDKGPFFFVDNFGKEFIDKKPGR